MLSRHSQICGSNPKEPYFFTQGGLEKADFEVLFTVTSQTVYQMDGSTDYTKAPFVDGVPERIKDYLDKYGQQARFIYILRDPIERISSHLRHVNLTGSDLIEQAVTPKEARSAVIERAAAISHYHRQLAPYKALFGAESIFVTSLGALKSDSEAVMGQIFAFLQLQSETDCHQLTQSNASADIEEWQNLPSYYKILSENPLVQVLKKIIPQKLLSRLRKGVSATKANHAPLSETEKNQLRQQLSADMAMLKADWGVDVGAWGFFDND